MKEVAHVRDGFSPQTNIVRINGQRGVLMSVYKTGNASTLDIVARVKRGDRAGEGVAAAGAARRRRCSISRCSSARRSRACCARRMIAAVPHRGR